MPPLIRIQLSEGPIDVAAQSGWLHRMEAGAVVSFTGLVRGEQGRVTALTLEHYEGMTGRDMEQIAASASERWSLLGVSLSHRVGALEPGDVIVFAGVASVHRAEAHAACEYVVDCLKSRAAFWKKEKRAGEWCWLEPREEDGERLKRWELLK